ncbi:metallophosphoesterase family protein [Chthonobacter rhizosphaerae]|uniref:metallophosphoesterase family protein n=1 Tax=Chthonobacter rhizosphaerae TaxID=2735553 RepID=UPI0015EF212D|nr:metallophosphoesterase family protein [Chthonobacter rhizosphaerae]
MLTTLMRRLSSPPAAPPRRRRRLSINAPYPVIYAIGDVHGCLRELRALEERIMADAAGRPGPKLVVMLGDYVDRGPQSAQVIEHLLAPMRPPFTRVCLCGNHDEFMLRFLDDPQRNMGWLGIGGKETLLSYGIDPDMMLDPSAAPDLAALVRSRVPEDHVAFLRSLPVLLEGPGILFVHAGVRPEVPLAEQTDDDLMLIREPFLTHGPGLPYLVVHGHSPEVEPTVGRLRVGIDTGAFRTGRLSAVRWDGQVTILR